MKCFDCEWFDCVGDICLNIDCMLYTTKENKELCDMMCGGNENK